MLSSSFSHFLLKMNENSFFIVEKNGKLLNRMKREEDFQNLQSKIFENLTALHESGTTFFSYSDSLNHFHVHIQKNLNHSYYDGYILDANYLSLLQNNKEQINRRISIYSNLKNAFKNDEFYLMYQPIYDVSNNQSTIVAAEVLLRWNDSSIGPVSPLELIPILEVTGLIHNIGHWIINQALMQLNLWHKVSNALIKANINISPIQLESPTFFNQFANSLQTNKVGPEYVVLELTEHSTLDHSNPFVCKNVRLLKELGIQIVIDDFGMGYNSLNTLSTLAVDGIKIDRTLMTRAATEAKDFYILKCLIDLASNLNLEIVAEGIENQKMLNFTKNIGCQFVQGYLFSKPLKAEQFLQSLRENSLLTKI